MCMSLKTLHYETNYCYYLHRNVPGHIILIQCRCAEASQGKGSHNANDLKVYRHSTHFGRSYIPNLYQEGKGAG